MESGSRTSGVTSDLSLGGCFVCTSKPLAIGTRVRIAMTRKSQTVEALAVVRILKPRIGMGIEFIDVERPYPKFCAGGSSKYGKAVSRFGLSRPPAVFSEAFPKPVKPHQTWQPAIRSSDAAGFSLFGIRETAR